MSKEIRMSLSDLYIGYVSAAFILYAVGGIAYAVGKAKAKFEITEKIKDVISETSTRENSN